MSNDNKHQILQDAEYMARAIKLAARGRYTTTPNPNVGCVIVSGNGEVIGEGFHLKAGQAHAEVHALQQAGENAKNATAYVTLEPCSHHGKTPPCADALIKAGVKRVVVAMQDPNPKVSGSGNEKLRSAGIQVDVGLLEQEARALNHGFIKRFEQNRPFITLKMAMSLDGKTALSNGKSQWVTSPASRKDVQRGRAASCAILSGSGTVLADDPSLNVRHSELGYLGEELVESEIRQPIRVIIDSKNQLSGEMKMFSLPGETWVFNTLPNDNLPETVNQYQVPKVSGKLDLAVVMQQLASKGINEVWVEAGAKLAGALIENKLVDKLILYVAPKLMGDKALGLFNLNELTEMDQVVELKWLEQTQVGDDLKLVASIDYQE